MDVVYNRVAENDRRLVKALKPFSPYLRDVPEGLPFILDEKTVQICSQNARKLKVGSRNLCLTIDHPFLF
jgi:hypothetical protein